MRSLGLIFVLLSALCSAEKVAITFDDLPLNGDLPPGVTRVQIARETLAVLKKRHVPPVHGFLNAKRLEGNPDAAEALKVWAAREPVGNHTYAHMDLTQNSAEAFESEIDKNEPVLELLARPDSSKDANKDRRKESRKDASHNVSPDANKNASWHWLRYPYLLEGDTQQKRRQVRTYLQAHGYRVAEVTLDWEDYLWNNAYARCLAKNDAPSIAWLRSSYLEMESIYLDNGRELARLLYGRDVNHVLLLHLGAFSSRILPDALDLLKKKGFQLTTLADAESDPLYQEDPDIGSKDGGTLLELWTEARKIKPPAVVDKPSARLEEICK